VIEVILNWGGCPPVQDDGAADADGATSCPGDLNGDGAVNTLDLQEVIDNFDDSTRAFNVNYWLTRRWRR
jgi:hypothetical protein